MSLDSQTGARLEVSSRTYSPALLGVFGKIGKVLGNAVLGQKEIQAPQPPTVEQEREALMVKFTEAQKSIFQKDAHDLVRALSEMDASDRNSF